MTTALEVDAILPQTQCGQCGYKHCFKYAEAIINGELINRCPPGGAEGIKKLATLLRRPELPLNLECGIHKPFEIAFIDISLCIGCKLCIDICPTDAIVGAKKHLHVVDIDMCSGCSLCVEACPVDCVSMIEAGKERSNEMSAKFRLLFQQKNERLAQRNAEKSKRLEEQSTSSAKKAFLSLLKKDLK